MVIYVIKDKLMHKWLTLATLPMTRIPDICNAPDHIVKKIISH